MTQVPEHAAIMTAAAEITPTTIEVQLPRVDAPLGRSLTDTDYRQVTWTIDHPDDSAVCSAIERRRRRVRRLVEEAEAGGVSPSIGAIAKALGVSDSTIRRDLTALRDQGLELTTRGSSRRAS
ncbi:MAG: DeoR family transcriptional regulator [Acidimicrobiia bacterium]